MDTTLKTSYKSIHCFRDAVESMYGINGGDASNPIWLCSLEWGGGFYDKDPTNPAEHLRGESVNKADEFVVSLNESMRWLGAKWADKTIGRPGGSSFYRSIFSILTALIEKDVAPNKLTRAKAALPKYAFLDKDRLGFSFNLSPISMKDHYDTLKHWTHEGLKLDDCDHLVSFAEWTGFSSYSEFFRWCAKQRFPIFDEARRRFNPRVIYCSGVSEINSFSQVWTGKYYEDAGFKIEPCITSTGKEFAIHFKWLESNPGKEPTLLVIGPFFGHRGSLNSYAGNAALAHKIQDIVEKRFPNKNWLNIEAFIPIENK